MKPSTKSKSQATSTARLVYLRWPMTELSNRGFEGLLPSITPTSLVLGIALVMPTLCT